MRLVLYRAKLHRRNFLEKFQQKQIFTLKKACKKAHSELMKILTLRKKAFIKSLLFFKQEDIFINEINTSNQKRGVFYNDSNNHRSYFNSCFSKRKNS